MSEKEKSIIAYIPSSLHLKLKIKCAKEKISIKDFVKDLIVKSIEEEGE